MLNSLGYWRGCSLLPNSLRPGDCVIQNAADELVGCCVLQLCRLLRLTCVAVVADTPAFPAVAERLKADYGAVIGTTAGRAK